jgi:hypothetical protein
MIAHAHRTESAAVDGYVESIQPTFPSMLVMDPPARWQAGQDLPIHVKSTGVGLPAPVLHYRPANQLAGAFRQLPMQRTDEGFAAVIPGAYLQPEWDLLLYVSVVLSPQTVLIYPGLYHPIHPLPYMLIAIA